MISFRDFISEANLLVRFITLPTEMRYYLSRDIGMKIVRRWTPIKEEVILNHEELIIIEP